MAATDARIQPIYGCKHREYITLVDSAGAVIAPSSPDTELIIDGAGAADATNELTEISSGDCYLDLTYTEMSAQAVLIRPKSTGALTRAFTLFPQRLPILRAGTAQAGAAGSITLDASASAKDGAYVGCLARASNNDPAGIQGEYRKIMGYTGSTKVATVAPNWTNTPTSATTFEILVPSDLSMVALLANSAEISDAVWDEILHGSKTARQLVGILLPAFAAGKVTGGGTTTITWRNTEDTLNAIVATVDANGNRSAVTINFA
jgi:hypothetical protein